MENRHYDVSCIEEQENDKEINFNYILEMSGGFGKQQKIMFIILCGLYMFYGFLMFGPMFMTLTPPAHWCSPSLETRQRLRLATFSHSTPSQTIAHVLSDLKNLNSSSNYFIEPNYILGFKINSTLVDSTDQILNNEYIKDLTIPRRKNGNGYEQCLMYDIDWKQINLYSRQIIPNESWPVIKCTDGWDYNFSIYYPTITTEKNWVCEEAQKVPFTQAMFFVGSLVGSPLFGWLANIKGRKFASIASNFMTGLAGVASALAPNHTFLCASMFILGMNSYSQLILFSILLTEFVTPRYRNFVANIPPMVFLTIGYTILPWLSYFIGNGRTLGIVLYSPLLFTPLIWWIVPESVRWLVGKNRLDEVYRILEKTSQMNGIQTTPEMKAHIKNYINHRPETNAESLWKLLKMPRLRKHFIATSLLMLSSRMLYDGHIRMSQAVDFNLFITFSIASALEFFSGLASYIMPDILGRRKSVVILFTVTAAIELYRAVVDTKNPYIQITLHFMGMIPVAAVINVAMMFPVEVMPTVVRTQATSTIHSFGFTTLFISPYIVYYASTYRSYAMLSLAGVATIGALTCMLLLPEARGQDLPDTLQEGEDFCRDQLRFWCSQDTDENRILLTPKKRQKNVT